MVNLHLLGDNPIPTTWDELVETAKKGTVRNGSEFDVRGFDFIGWDGVAYTFAEMVMSQGVSYFKEDGTFNVTSPEAKKASSAPSRRLTAASFLSSGLKSRPVSRGKTSRSKREGRWVQANSCPA